MTDVYGNDSASSDGRGHGIAEDIRQAGLVSKYEVIKFFSGKKIFIYAGLMILVYGLLTFVFFKFGGDDLSAAENTQTYFSFVTLLLLIGATLFSAGTLVSEFEERTALTLFTKPVHKISIFVGKFAAAYLLNVATMLLYCILVVIAVAIKNHAFATEIIPAFGYCSLYALALTGIAILFSAVMKKSSSASILTFVFILFVPSIVAVLTMAVARSGDVMESWYVLDVAANSMINCFDGPVEHGPRDALVMLLWGIVPSVAAYFLFKRREV